MSRTKTKISIEEKLEKRKIKTPSNLAWMGYAFLSRLPFIFTPKYHPVYKIVDDINKEKGPAIIIWNHQSRRDYLFIKTIVAPRKFNMVAGYQEFFRKKFKLLFDWVQVIPKKQFVNDAASLKQMMTVIANNGTLCFAPEGMSSIYGHNQQLVPGTGRFLKFFKVPIYFIKIEGAYLSSKKTCIDDSPGKVYVTEYRLFSKEDLTKLTPDQIEDRINEEFKLDDFEWNKVHRIKYKTHKKAAHNLETMIYKCPKCGKEFTMKSSGDKIFCTSCGNGVSIDDYYDFHPLNEDYKGFETSTAWIDWQRKLLIKEIRKDENYSFSFHAKVGTLPKYKYIKDKNAASVPCGEGDILIDHKGFHFTGIVEGNETKFDVKYDILFTLVIENDTTMFSLFIDGKCYEFKPTIPCVGKTLLLVEEMHRLHSNRWKPLKWDAHMYKGTELEGKI